MKAISVLVFKISRRIKYHFAGDGHEVSLGILFVRQSGITWPGYESLHSQSGNIAILFAFLAGLRTYEPIDDAVESVVFAYEHVAQSDDPWLFAHVAKLQPDQSELFSKSKLQLYEPKLFAQVFDRVVLLQMILLTFHFCFHLPLPAVLASHSCIFAHITELQPGKPRLLSQQPQLFSYVSFLFALHK